MPRLSVASSLLLAAIIRLGGRQVYPLPPRGGKQRAKHPTSKEGEPHEPELASVHPRGPGS